MELKENIPSYRVMLANEYASHTHRNPSFSLRAFSKKLGVSPATLSQILSGKRPLSRKSAQRIIDRCGMTEEAAKDFLASANGVQTSATTENDEAFDAIQLEAFKVISEWYHYAILSLGDITPNRHSPRWLSKRLGISEKEASHAFHRLEKLGLVERKGLQFRQVGKPLRVPSLKENHALKKAHLQNLRRAEELLQPEQAAMELYSTITMAVDESNLEKARTMIRDFRRQVCRELEKGNRKRVYTLAVQLFPVSQKESL